jgi:hypothetical protein
VSSYKGDDCWSVSRDEFMADMKAGAVLNWWKFGPMYYQPGTRRECHPRRDTARKAIERGDLIKLPYLNQSQRQCGMARYGISDVKAAIAATAGEKGAG